MKNKEEMYEYLEWIMQKIKEDKDNLNWIGDEDCACVFENDTRTEEDKEKGCQLVELCYFIKGLNPELSEKITKKYNIFEKEEYGNANFLSYPCVCFKYKNNYYFIRHLPYFGGDTNLSIINQEEAEEYGFVEL